MLLYNRYHCESFTCISVFNLHNKPRRMSYHQTHFAYKDTKSSEPGVTYNSSRFGDLVAPCPLHPDASVLMESSGSWWCCWEQAAQQPETILVPCWKFNDGLRLALPSTLHLCVVEIKYSPGLLSKLIMTRHSLPPKCGHQKPMWIPTHWKQCLIIDSPFHSYWKNTVFSEFVSVLRLSIQCYSPLVT